MASLNDVDPYMGTNEQERASMLTDLTALCAADGCPTAVSDFRKTAMRVALVFIKIPTKNHVSKISNFLLRKWVSKPGFLLIATEFLSSLTEFFLECGDIPLDCLKYVPRVDAPETQDFGETQDFRDDENDHEDEENDLNEDAMPEPGESDDEEGIALPPSTTAAPTTTTATTVAPTTVAITTAAPSTAAATTIDLTMDTEPPKYTFRPRAEDGTERPSKMIKIECDEQKQQEDFEEDCLLHDKQVREEEQSKRELAASESKMSRQVNAFVAAFKKNCGDNAIQQSQSLAKQLEKLQSGQVNYYDFKLSFFVCLFLFVFVCFFLFFFVFFCFFFLT